MRAGAQLLFLPRRVGGLPHRGLAIVPIHDWSQGILLCAGHAAVVWGNVRALFLRLDLSFWLVSRVGLPGTNKKMQDTQEDRPAVALPEVWRFVLVGDRISAAAAQ